MGGKIGVRKLLPFTVAPKMGGVIIMGLFLVKIAIKEIKALFPGNSR
jgi:hypothetical protein